MSTSIQLEYMTCQNCGRDMERWNLKAEVVDGVLCVRCPHCREHLRLVMKGGVSEDDMQGAINKTLEQTITEKGD
jgi:NAD-dependent SIR2 family protein deacetylase